jgi:hypothetical protein
VVKKECSEIRSLIQMYRGLDEKHKGLVDSHVFGCEDCQKWCRREHIDLEILTVGLWSKCRKKPVVLEVREVIGRLEVIKTLEGELIAKAEKHFIIRGVNGEQYPIEKSIFKKTYEMIQ